MITHEVTYVDGDGIGPEICAAARRAVDEATGGRVHWVAAPLGEAARERFGTSVPESTLATLREATTVLKGPVTSVPGDRQRPNQVVRRVCELQVNVRVVNGAGVDLILVRDVTEDLPNGAEQRLSEGAAVALRPVTRTAVRRAARRACDYAVAHGRRLITVAHKVSALPVTDGLLLAAADEVIAEYAGLEIEHEAIDTLAYRMISKPSTLDVVLTGFHYGDILAGVCAGVLGTPAHISGGSYGPRTAVFEAAHGTAPRHANRGTADANGLIGSAALLLDHLGEPMAAARLRGGDRRR